VLCRQARQGSEASVDFLSLYIPASPSESLARGVAPAAVVFSVALGLIAVECRGPLIESLSALEDDLLEVTNRVVRHEPDVAPFESP
jgi:Na+/H+-dicarboxylate symporter